MAELCNTPEIAGEITMAEVISVAIRSPYPTEIGIDNIVTAPNAVTTVLLTTKVLVDAVHTSPSILNVAAEPVKPNPTVSILAHPAVPLVAAVPVYPAAVPKATVPHVAPIVPLDPPQPIAMIVQSKVPEVPESADAGWEPV
jgi:hypothetical protein